MYVNSDQVGLGILGILLGLGIGGAPFRNPADHLGVPGPGIFPPGPPGMVQLLVQVGIGVSGILVAAASAVLLLIGLFGMPGGISIAATIAVLCAFRPLKRWIERRRSLRPD